jgi:hypothetical protein
MAPATRFRRLRNPRWPQWPLSDGRTARIDIPAAGDYPPGVGTALLAALVCASRIVITEVMADPKGITGSHYPVDRNEFVELYNASYSTIDLLDWTIDDGDAVDRLRARTDSSILNAESLRLGTTSLDPGCYTVVLDPEYTEYTGTGTPFREAPGHQVH